MAEAGEPVSGSAPAHPPTGTPANIEDKLTAAVQLLLPGLQPDAAYLRRLLDSVADGELLLACLQAMLARGERYADSNLLYSQVLYSCTQSGGLFPSPFLYEWRAQQAARESRWRK